MLEQVEIPGTRESGEKSGKVEVVVMSVLTKGMPELWKGCTWSKKWLPRISPLL
jgi:hypothetical protein